MPDVLCSREDAKRLLTALLSSYSAGSITHARARYAVAKLQTALLAYRLGHRGDASPDVSPELRQVVAALHEVEFGDYEAADYVVRISFLVHATMLLDTFVQDAIELLLFLHPAAVGHKTAVAFGDILSASSRLAVVEKAIRSKVRELGHLAFLDRVTFLRSTFGLAVDLTAEQVDQLRHYSSVRNAVVHDQGAIEFALDESGQVIARQKTCPKRPTPVTTEDIQRAGRTYEALVFAIARSIAHQVLKCADEPEIARMLEPLRPDARLEVPETPLSPAQPPQTGST